MKTLFKLLGILFVTTFVFASCSKDDDPSDNDLFVGTYEGTVSYANLDDSESNVSSRDGSVRVVKLGGDNYNFLFSDGIPDLTGITMTKGDNNNLVFEDGELGYIRITAGKLTIAYARDNQTWTADGDR